MARVLLSCLPVDWDNGGCGRSCHALQPEQRGLRPGHWREWRHRTGQLLEHVDAACGEPDVLPACAAEAPPRVTLAPGPGGVNEGDEPVGGRGWPVRAGVRGSDQ